uniref:Uncharacterized protein n=1 Tax=Mesocestoides corti TaxID=53468 RepID=A0A5K3F1S5_MESCO
MSAFLYVTTAEYPSPKRKKNWYNRTGCIDQSEARATRLAPSIRVRHAGHAAHSILLLSRVLLWLAASLPRKPLERRGTQDWLRPGGPTCLLPDTSPHHIKLHYISSVQRAELIIILIKTKIKLVITICNGSSMSDA